MACDAEEAIRCNHDWQPLITVNTDGMSDPLKLQAAFSLALQRINHYDRCSHCGRLSYVTPTRFRRRKLVSNQWLVERIMERVAEFETWLKEQASVTTINQAFTCPQCGGHYFGRDTAPDEHGRTVALDTVRCHCDQQGISYSADGNGPPCGWRGVWPKKGG